MGIAHDIRRRRQARAAASAAVPHPWSSDAAADLRRRLDNYRRSLAVAVTAEDRGVLADEIGAVERQLAGLDRGGHGPGTGPGPSPGFDPPR